MAKILRPKNPGTYFVTLLAQQAKSSSCDFNAIIGGVFGVHVWTWGFVVSPATELVVTEGSVFRETQNSLLPVGR
jgi:hypothetical protein